MRKILVLMAFFTGLLSLAGCGPERGGNTPSADAGQNQNILIGTLVTLDGSASYDADPDTLTYHWSFILMPEGSSATLSDRTTVNPTFTPDLEGLYILELVVSDGILFSTTTAVGITAASGNALPDANAGPSQNVVTGTLVTLVGSDSSDADGDLLTYNWSFVNTPIVGVILSGATTVNPSFTPPVNGLYLVKLVVNDGTINSAPTTTTVIASTANSAPVANAGPNQNVATGSTVALDGRDSYDTNGDILTYDWSFSSIADGGGVTLTGGDTVNPSFVAVNEGTYVLNLLVNDGTLNSEPAAVTITAATANSAPVANAGPNQNVATGSLVTLDGINSLDADNDTLSYVWSFSSLADGSGITPTGGTEVEFSFIPDVDGAYVLNLVVNDGTVNSQPATVTITAATVNSVPIANAGTDQTVAVGSTVFLDGSGSYDADFDDLTYDWSFISFAGGGVTLTGGTTAFPSFSADDVGSYVLDLVVNDGTEDSAASTVIITSQ